MKYSIVFSSRTGNTRLLADTIKEHLNAEDCVYFGEPDEKAAQADLIFAGFWTDKGTCDAKAEEFIKTLKGKNVFLFGTAGFGVDASYFEQILSRVSAHVDESCTVTGSFMCQGKMPMSVRERYEKMAAAPTPAPNVQMLIDNFDKALSHPDQNDLEALMAAVDKAK